MATSYTSLLGFALPVTGELQGTWGDTVNNSITQLCEDSIAGYATASVASGDWTLTTTGSGANNQARMAILIPTGTPGVSRNIIAPSKSKAYIVVNQSNAAVVVKGAATTGVTIATGKTALVAWNGSDFIEVSPSTATTATNLAGGVASQIPYQSAANTTSFIPNGTSGQVLVSAGTSAPGFSSNLNGIAIGSTTPSTGAFTTLSGSGQLTLTNANNYNLYASGLGANYMAGSLGIGTIPTTTTNRLIVAGAGLTASSFQTIDNQTYAPSTATGTVENYRSILGTAAGSFTLANMHHFTTSASALGASSAVTNQVGFYAYNTLTTATNNYGFYGNIASGTGRYNLYMGGTADNYLAGSLGIGSVAGADSVLQVNKAITSGTTEYITRTFVTVPSNITNAHISFSSNLYTAAAAFNLNLYTHYDAGGSNIGAGSSVSNLRGFSVSAIMTGATNNYGFFGGIAAGSGRYNLYMVGTAVNYLAGSLWLGTTTPGHVQFANYLPITGGSSAYSNSSNPTVTSDVTNSAVVHNTYVATQAAAFTLGNLSHYLAGQGSIGAGSAITNQYGFNAGSSLTGATNNYGFIGGIAAGTGRYNLYMNGTADNYLAGRLGVGATPPSAYSICAGGALTGATTMSGVVSSGAVAPDVTSQVRYFQSNLYTAASTSLGMAIHYLAESGSIGAGSTVTNQMGFYASINLTGATNNYGFYGNITSGTGRYNLYMAGTADNWFNGNVWIGGAGGLGYTTGSGGAVTQITSRTTGVTLNKTNGAITLVSAAGSATYQSFTVTNSTVAATDTIIINQKSGTDLYEVIITAVAAGSFRVTFRTTGGTTTEQPVFNFSVIKAVTA